MNSEKIISALTPPLTDAAVPPDGNNGFPESDDRGRAY